MMEINIFQELFLSTEMWGYFGPVGLIAIGLILTKKERSLGVLMFLIDCLCMYQYSTLLEATPDYYWHMIILLLGGILTLIPSMTSRR